jgi:hypothetical protein
MSILSNHFPEVLDELNADPDRPADPQPTEEEINAIGEAAGELLRRKPRKPRAKPARTVRLTFGPPADNPFSIITIPEGRKVDDYIVRPMPSDWGTAFQVKKIFDADQKVYRVLVDGVRCNCECLGHMHHGHCRHVEALQTLRQHGML